MGKDFNVDAYKSPTNAFMKLGSKYAGECTTYAWGRAYEVVGSHKLPNTGAGTWYAAKHGYTTDKTPKASSIACFSGHVAFVESVSGSNVTYSEANWYDPKTDSRYGNGKWEPDPDGTDGKLKTKTQAEFEKQTGGGTFQGYIHLK